MRVAFCLVLLWGCGVCLVQADLEIRSGPGQLMGFQWGQIDLHYRPGEKSTGWSLRVTALIGPEGQDLGDLDLDCREPTLPVTDGCARGHLVWQRDDLMLEADFRAQRTVAGWTLGLDGQGVQLEAEVVETDEGLPSVQVTFNAADLSMLPAAWLEQMNMNVVTGQLTGELRLDTDILSGQIDWTQGGFDSVDGLLAADGLALGVEFDVHLDSEPRRFSGELVQTAGELLAGSLYLPEPASPLTLDLQGYLNSDGIEISNWHLIDPGALSARGSLGLVQDEQQSWTPASVSIQVAEIHFPLAWQRWIDGHAAAAGFAGLETEGMVRLDLDWWAEQPLRLDARLTELSIGDPQQRFELVGIDGSLAWQTSGPASELVWNSLTVYGLELGTSHLHLVSEDGQVNLARPLRMPLLDGAVVIDHLDWRPGTDQGFGFDARIEPLSLSQLTRTLEWPEFGGTLSGDFPGIVYANERLRVTGGIDIQAFSGQVRIDDLAVERPFGTLPALAAQVEVSRLDLLELTGAFNFGRMEGEMSGWMRNLRLLDWRPVAMDTRVFTHDDASRRRISQRAVNNLSSLGGAGGALMTGTLLRVFEDFPYRRAGLACRLSNNICYIDGVAPHDSGGFYIVEGRSLPRLDIIGHRRLVDWPQLMSQLENMIE
jgi:hypothetical protein